MGFSFVDYTKGTPGEGMSNPLANILAGIQAQQMFKQDLLKKQYSNDYDKVKAQYAPVTLPAEAASKLAYASLLGPQYLAKMFGNKDFLANVPDAQKNDVLQAILAAGQNASKIPSSLGFNGGQPTQQPQQPTANPANPNQAVPLPFGLNKLADQNTLSSSLSANPAQPTAVNPNGSSPLNSSPPINPSTEPTSTDWAENTGDYQGKIKEGEKKGEIRATQMGDLDTARLASKKLQTSLDELNGIVIDPTFQNMMKVPLLGAHNIGWYSKFGNDKEQELAGNLLTHSGNVIKSSVRDFPGQFRIGVQSLLNTMKVNPGDMPAVAKGKLEALNYLNQMTDKRNELISQYMNKNHMSLNDAISATDKIMDPKKIKEAVYDKLHPLVTIRNKKTGEVKTLTIDEARKLMGAQ